jgi:hypothetical protein
MVDACSAQLGRISRQSRLPLELFRFEELSLFEGQLKPAEAQTMCTVLEFDKLAVPYSLPGRHCGVCPPWGMPAWMSLCV